MEKYYFITKTQYYTFNDSGVLFLNRDESTFPYMTFIELNCKWNEFKKIERKPNPNDPTDYIICLTGPEDEYIEWSNQHFLDDNSQLLLGQDLCSCISPHAHITIERKFFFKRIKKYFCQQN